MSENSITWIHVEQMRGSKRTIEAHGIRTSQAKLKLTKEQRQASMDIDRGYDALAKGAGLALLGIKTANMSGVGGGEMSEVVIDKMRYHIGRMHQWQFETPNHQVYSVEAINQHGYTARSFSELVGRDKNTIIDWYKRGLDNFVEIFYRA